MTNNLMRPSAATSAFSPPPINSVEDTGLNVLWLQDLALKILYNQGFMSGFKIAEAIALPFAGVTDGLLEALKREKMIEVKSSQGGLGEGAYTYGITGAGIAIDATAIANGAIDAATFASGAIYATALASDAADEIATAIMTPAISTWETAAAATSLCGALMQAVHKTDINDSTGNLDVYKSDGLTKKYSRTVTTATGRDPIDSFGGAA